MKRSLSISLLVGLALAVVAGVRADEVLEDQESLFSGGGSFTFKYYNYVSTPRRLPPGVPPTRTRHHTLRLQSYLWGQLRESEDTFALYGKLAHEVWHQFRPAGKAPFNWPDEVVVDQLYLDIPQLFSPALSLRVGRQDLAYGSGRLLADGTPGDQSRTGFFDAVKLQITFDEQNQVDLLGIYNTPKAGLALGNRDRHLTGFNPFDNDLTESGGGIYARLLQQQAVPLDLYYLLKVESRWLNRRPGSDEVVREAGRKTHTVGARLLPRISQNVTAELEGAWQFGSIDNGGSIRAFMLYGGVDFVLPTEIYGVTPWIRPAVYFLSGDRQSTARDEGWNPIWSRYPQLSDLYIGSFGADKGGYWSNLIYPHLRLTLPFATRHDLSISAGTLLAHEKDGPADGGRRGDLYSVTYRVPLAKSLWLESDSLAARVFLEMFDPGSYYHEAAHKSYFIRCDLSYAF